MDDLISRQAAIKAIGGIAWLIPEARLVACDKIRALPSAEPRWIPIKTRPMDEEERAYWSEHLGYDIEYEDAVMFDCPMPEDGQEVWVCSKCGNVWQDTCEVDEGIGLEENGDWMDIIAWMPFKRPEPWKGEDNAETD